MVDFRVFLVAAAYAAAVSAAVREAAALTVAVLPPEARVTAHWLWPLLQQQQQQQQPVIAFPAEVSESTLNQGPPRDPQCHQGRIRAPFNISNCCNWFAAAVAPAAHCCCFRMRSAAAAALNWALGRRVPTEKTAATATAASVIAAAPASGPVITSPVLPGRAFVAMRELLLAADTPDPLLQHREGVSLEVSLLAAACGVPLLCSPCSRIYLAAPGPSVTPRVNPKS